MVADSGRLIPRYGKEEVADNEWACEPKYLVSTGGASKRDHEKEMRPELVSPEFILGTSAVLAKGAIKYSDGNWAKGMRWSRAYGALQRHLLAWVGGEKCDPEFGYSHLWHASCCLMFLITYEVRGIGHDDRKEIGLTK